MRVTRPRRVCPWAAAALLLWSVATSAQEPAHRPKIGLALGGGGARGAAHIGVLKVLEDLRIPIDYVAGTSMGSIVGGLYATGYSPDELEKIVQKIDWAGIFSDAPPRKQRSFRRKEDDFLYALGLEVGLKGGLTLPSGLLAGRKLSFLLQTLTMPAAGIDDFDRLEIPFHAVAADVQTGEVVVLSKGNLGKALRASMAIPVAFTPVELDGRLLIDGGNAQNLPVQTVKAMGPDVIIAVDVGSSGEIPTEKPKTATGILGRLIDIPLLQNTVASRKLANVVIIPNLKGLGTADFQKTAQIIPRGEAAARALAPELERYSVSEQEYRAWREKHRAPLPPPPAVREVTVAPIAGLDPRRIKHFVKSKPGPIDTATLDKDLERLYGTGLFENVEFELQGRGAERELHIIPTSKPWGPTYLRVGLNLSSDFNGGSSFGVLGLLDATEMNRIGAEWKTAVEIGTSQDVATQFFQPLGYTSDFFIAPRGSFFQYPVDIFDNQKNQRVATYRVRRSLGGLDLGYDVSTVAELRAGLQWGHGNATLRTGSADLPDLDVATAAVVGRLRVDQLDDAALPKRGYFANLEFKGEREGLGGALDYDRLEASALGAFTLGRLTTILRGRWGDPLGSTIPFYDQFTLGGFLNLSGYAHNQLYGSSYGFAEAVFYYRLSSGGAIIQGTYLGASAEAGTVWAQGQPRSLGDFRGAGSVFLSAETLFGPFYFAYGFSGSKHTSFYVFLSRSF
ncbi:MAG: patatin-like phospholipase family protein [Acidithiobacillales bacterium]